MGDPLFLDARASIQKMEDETIPDLESEKRDVQQKLEQLQEEIHAAQEKIELKKQMHELEIRKKILQEEARPS